MKHTPARALTLGLGLLLVASTAIADSSKSTFFNGKNLDGFEGKDLWSVKDGSIVADTGPKGIRGNTFLCSKIEYGNFELSFQVRLKGGKGNSGVQIRSTVIDKKNYVVKGPQCDIGQVYWGSLYGEKFGGMMKKAPTAKVKKALKPTEFNDYYIKAVGKHVTIKLNGETMVDQAFDKMPLKGIIAFQAHAGPSMEVTFRNIKFTQLK